MKEQIKEFVMQMGVDDVGFASVANYYSPNSPNIKTIFPEVKSIVVMAFKELSTCESPSMQIAMNGRLDLMEFSRSCNYKLARFLERNFGAKAMTVGASYPLEMSLRTKGSIGEVSLRHAALAAGLGTFGRHNLILHPKFGSRVIFTAVLSNLEIEGDQKLDQDICIQCDICVNECPGRALEQEGKTHLMKCLSNSQPYGLGGNIKFWQEFAGSTAEEQKTMVQDERFWKLYQAGFIGFQYCCFNCIAKCPIAKEG